MMRRSKAGIELEFGVLVFVEGGNRKTRKKILGAGTRNKTSQPSLNRRMTPGLGIDRTQATVVGGERFQQCTILASLNTPRGI